MILIVSNSVDLVDPVTKAIEITSGEDVVLVRADLCLDNEGFSFSYSDGITKVFADRGLTQIEIADVRKAWFWKPMLPKVLREYEPHEDAIFIHRQFLAMWRSLTSLLVNTEWLNDYYSMLEAEHKPYQLKVAGQVGFRIPDTLITANPDRAVRFWDACNHQMVIKTLVVSPYPKKVVFTNQVTKTLMKDITRIKSSPVILQKLIPKKYELRITVVNDKVFPASMNSNATVDWRRGLISATSVDLPESIRQKCIDLVSSLNLHFGCIDMILGQDEEYYFLEINPNGQWRFVEDQTRMPIGAAIAEVLVS